MIKLVTLLFFKKYECKISSFTFSIIKVVHIIMPKTYSYEFKLSVINFYYSKFWNISDAIKIFNASKSIMYKWINLYKNKLLIRDTNIRTTYNRSLSNEVEKYIITYIEKRVNFVYKNLKSCIKRIFNTDISKSSIYRILKKHNITNKKIYKKLTLTKKNIVQQICDLKNKVKNIGIDNIVSLDESSFDTHICQQTGWSKKGTRINTILNPVRKRKTLTLAIKNNCVLAHTITNNSSNAVKFETFLKTTLLPKIKNETILMDNVRFHHSKNVINCILENGNKILYNVPYNPDTNPVENCFSLMKKYVSKIQPTTENQLSSAINKSLKILCPKKLNNMFGNSFNK